MPEFIANFRHDHQTRARKTVARFSIPITGPTPPGNPASRNSAAMRISVNRAGQCKRRGMADGGKQQEPLRRKAAMASKIETGNLTRKGMGRPKGVPNKTTKAAKDMIAEVAEGLGGAKRMLAWAKEAPENERAFWTSVYPKLIPLTVGSDPDNPLAPAIIHILPVAPHVIGDDQAS